MMRLGEAKCVVAIDQEPCIGAVAAFHWHHPCLSSLSASVGGVSCIRRGFVGRKTRARHIRIFGC